MQTRKAVRVLPEPVGAEMSVGSPRRMLGQPSICGSVGVPNFAVNHSCTKGWAHASAGWISRAGADDDIGHSTAVFALCSPAARLRRKPNAWRLSERRLHTL